MINQGFSKQMLLKQIKKAFNRHPEAFQKDYIMALDIVSKIAVTKLFHDGGPCHIKHRDFLYDRDLCHERVA